MTLGDKIHWHLGMILGKKYRYWDYKNYNNNWLWGIYSFINNNNFKGNYDRKKRT